MVHRFKWNLKIKMRNVEYNESRSSLLKGLKNMRGLKGYGTNQAWCVVGIFVVLTAGSEFSGSRPCEEFPVAYNIPVCVVSVV
jgi:hypothetical protein